MATKIIGQGTAAPLPRLRIVAATEVQEPAAAPAQVSSGSRDRSPLEFEKCLSTDLFNGTAEALIAAGLCRRDQLPGEPGNPKTVSRFLDGRPVPRYVKACRNAPTYLSIYSAGKGRYEILKGISDEERERRWSDHQQARRDEERARQDALAEEAELKLAQKRRARTAQEFSETLLRRIEGVRASFNSYQRGEDFMYDWCLKQGDMQAVLACLAGLEQAIRNAEPVRHVSAKVANLRVVTS